MLLLAGLPRELLKKSDTLGLTEKYDLIYQLLFLMLLLGCAAPRYSYYFDRVTVEKLNCPPITNNETMPTGLATAILPGERVPMLDDRLLAPAAEGTKLSNVQEPSVGRVREFSAKPKSVSSDTLAVPKKKFSRMAIAGFVSAVLAPFVTWLILPLALAGGVFSLLGLREIRTKGNLRGRGLAMAGLIISIAEILLLLVIIVIVVAMFASPN